MKARTVLMNSVYDEHEIELYIEKDMFTRHSMVDLSYAKMLSTLKTYLPNIRSLCVTSSVRGLFDKNVHLIGEYLPYLRNLYLHASNLNDEGLSRLFSKCPNLQHLSLIHAHITGDCFSQVPPLKSLNITNTGEMFQSIDGFDRLSDSLISFQADFHRNNAVKSRRLFKSFKKIKKFSWSVNSQNDLVEVLNSVSMYGKLEELVLRVNREIESPDLQWMQDFASIKSLSLFFRYAVSVDKLLHILNPCSNVSSLSLQLFHLIERGENTEQDESKLLLRVVNAIKQMQSLTVIDFEMRREEPYVIKLNDCFKWMLESERFREISFGFLSDEEVNSIIEYLQTAQRESNARFYVEIQVQTDSVIRIPLDIPMNIRSRRRRYRDTQPQFLVYIKRLNN
ncbi:hypothetical protein B4U80_12971 [Leptotrombidium deliense]|uniref:Uncharacterized protein n=1 Tax=Leptotrombidium deliense TaxID=299467 RepID=A0A443SG17_9ACAR|nr:hypothetical protein B4U80_12971 [Leptotrombidium deliense]